MATKTLTITEDSYDRLDALKENNESFSEVIRRLTSKVRLMDFAGVLTDEEAKRVKGRISHLREESAKRMKAIRKSLQ